MIKFGGWMSENERNLLVFFAAAIIIVSAALLLFRLDSHSQFIKDCESIGGEIIGSGSDTVCMRDGSVIFDE